MSRYTTEATTGATHSPQHMPVYDPEDPIFRERLADAIHRSALSPPRSARPVEMALLVGPTQSGKTKAVNDIAFELGYPLLSFNMSGQGYDTFVSSTGFASRAEGSAARTVTTLEAPPFVREIYRLQRTVAQAAQKAWQADPQQGDVATFRDEIERAHTRHLMERNAVSASLLALRDYTDNNLRHLLAATKHINQSIHGIAEGEWMHAPVAVFIDEANKGIDLLPTLLTLAREGKVGEFQVPHIGLAVAMTDGGANQLQALFAAAIPPDLFARVAWGAYILPSPKTTFENILRELPEAWRKHHQTSMQHQALFPNRPHISSYVAETPDPTMAVRLVEAVRDARLAMGEDWLDPSGETPTNWWNLLSPPRLAILMNITKRMRQQGGRKPEILKALAREVASGFAPSFSGTKRIAEEIAKIVFETTDIRTIEGFDLSSSFLMELHTRNLRERGTPPWVLDEEYTSKIVHAVRMHGDKAADSKDRKKLVAFLSEFSDYLTDLNDRIPHRVLGAVYKHLPHPDIQGMILEALQTPNLHLDVLTELGRLKLVTAITTSPQQTDNEELQLWARAIKGERDPFNYTLSIPNVEI